MKKKIKYIKNVILDEEKEILFIKKLSEKNINFLMKRIKKEVSNTHKYSISTYLLPILDDIDSLEKAITLSESEPNLKLIKKELLEILKIISVFFIKNNIVTINDINSIFDPKIHQAIALAPSHSVKSNHIITVMQKGYKLHNRLLRPAMVLVAQ